MNYIEMNADQFASKLKELAVGEGFNFATYYDSEDIENGFEEEYLEDWYGVYREDVFDRVLFIVAKYGRDFSDAISDSDNIVEDVEWLFESIDTDTAYVQDGVSVVKEARRGNTVVEPCPHCEREVEMRWDVKKDGYKAFCPHCGKRLMLCDECLHRGDGGELFDDCNYNSQKDTCRFNEATGRGEMRVAVNADFTATLEGIAESGESITIPSAAVNQICEDSDERNVMQDIRAQSADYDLVADLSEEELRKLAKSVIRRRDNCDGISERYWSIVDEVIREFLVTKEQET